LGDDNPAVRARVSTGDVVNAVHIDAFANFLKVAAEILSAERSGAKHPDQGAHQKSEFAQTGGWHKSFFLEGI
jgi:hypothetical protein